jgi:tetratricopeptide (TPR) repeat protein
MRPGREARVARILIGLGLALGLGLLGAGSVSGRQADARRVALVITNEAAGPDVAAGGVAISGKLRSLGYDVTPATNAGLLDLGRAEGRLEGQVDANTVVAIYYAGYAVRANNRDYLLPAGATPTSATGIANVALDLTGLVQRLRDKGALVTVFVDGCRRSPVLDALGGNCAGDPSNRERDIYLISAASRLPPGDLTGQLDAVLRPGRSVVEVFEDLQSRFGLVAVIQTPAQSGIRAAATGFGRGAPVAAPQPASTPAVAPARVEAPPPPSAPSLPDDGVKLPDYLSEILETADFGDVNRARARAAEFEPRYGRLFQSFDERTRLVTEAVLAYVNGDYEKAVRDVAASRAVEASGGYDAFPAGTEGRRSRIEGSAYLRLGRLPDAISRLERSRAKYLELGDGSKLGPVQTLLGEAYRRAGRRADARGALVVASQTQTGAGKGAAYLQMALLAYDEGDANDSEAKANTAIQMLNGPPPSTLLAEAYVAVGRARLKLRPNGEGEAWRYLDMAREVDRRSPAVAAFERELPTRLVNPPFQSMRPRFTFARDIERRAMTCYETSVDRDAYLALINREVAALNAYIGRLDAYSRELTRLIGDYEARGYLADYQGVVQGRGYRFRQVITDEQSAVATWRERSVIGRTNALLAWHPIAARAAVPCEGQSPSPMAPPAGYSPNLPPGDIFVSAAPEPDSPAPTLAVAPVPAPARRADPAPPMATAAALAPPVVTAPPPAAVVAPPPPRPMAVAEAPPPRPALAIITPAPTPEPARPPALASASPPGGQTPVAAKPITTPPPEARTAASPSAPPPVVQAPAPARPVAVAPAPAPPKAVVAAPTPRPSTPAAQPVPQPTPPPPAPQPTPQPAPPPAQGLVVPPPVLIAAPTPAPPPVAPPPAKPAAKPPAGKAPVLARAPAGPAAAKAAVDRGAALFAQGKFDLAQREYALAVEADASNLDGQAGVLAARGLASLQAGKVAAAIDELTNANTIKPMPEALEALGRIFAANGNRDAAIDKFSEAIKLRPTYAQAYFGRAEVLRERGSPLSDEALLNRAVDDYRMALTVRPDLPEALLGMGMTRFALKDFAGAITSLDGALKARPIFPEAKYARARSRFELGQHQDALNDLVDLPASFDVYARSCSTGLAYSAMGYTALMAKDDPRAMELYREAEKAFNEALKVRPGDKSAKLGADQSRQTALDNFIGSGVREALRRLPAGRQRTTSPTATLSYADACKKS